MNIVLLWREVFDPLGRTPESRCFLGRSADARFPLTSGRGASSDLSLFLAIVFFPTICLVEPLCEKIVGESHTDMSCTLSLPDKL